jgi:hypothetical protein
VTFLFDAKSLEVLLEDDEVFVDGECPECVTENTSSPSLFDVESLDELLEDNELSEDDERPDFVCGFSATLDLLPVLPSLFPDGEL